MGQIIFHKKDKIPTVSVELKKAKATDTHGYLKLRVKHRIRREPFLIALGQRLDEKYWDSKRNRVKMTMPGADTLNNTIDTETARVTMAFSEFVNGGGQITEAVILAVIGGAEIKEGDFLQFMKERIEFKSKPDKDGKMSVSPGYIKHLWIEYNRLYKYCNGYLPFSKIDIDWIEGYETYLSPKIAATTLSVKMKRLMEYITLAVDRGYIDRPKIAGYEKPDYLDPERQYLNAEQVAAIEDLIYKNKISNDKVLLTVACFFVVECYSGLRFSDWGRFTVETVLNEPALRVRAKKNGEYVYLYLNQWPKLTKICNYITKHKLKFDLPERETNAALKTIRHLAKIPFEFTTHNGRHTAATFLAMLGYSDNEGAEILGIAPSTFAIYRRQTRQGSRLAQNRHGGI